MSRATNLVRTPAGIYFVHAKIFGKLHHKSLKTDVESVAIRRRDAYIAEERERQGHHLRNRSTMGGIFESFTTKSATDREIRQRTKRYHRELILSIRKHWPGIDAMDAGRIKPAEVEKFFDRMRDIYAPSRFNGLLDVMRQCFAEAIRIGCRYDNPCRDVKRERPNPKRNRFPSTDDLQRIIADLSQYNGLGRMVIEFLSLTGARMEESRHVRWSDVDFTKRQILFRGEFTKNSEDKRIPFFGRMEELLNELKEVERTRKAHRERAGYVLPVARVDKMIARACTRLGIEHFSPHDLRHRFTTLALQSGVDVPTVARWLGHKDGGKLLLTDYAHILDSHSQAMAAKVRL